MPDLSFDPVVGEEVSALGQNGRFQIIGVRPSGHPSLGAVDLQLIGTEYVIRDVPWSALSFDDARLIRRFLEWLREEGKLTLPAGIKGFDVRSGEKYDGEPKFVVRFQLDSNVEPTEKRAREWNDFTSNVREQILTRLPVDRWVQVMVQQDRGSLHAVR